MRVSNCLPGILLAMLCGASAADQPAVAHAAQEVRVDITSQPLRLALTEFARQTGVQLLFSEDEVPVDANAPRLVGTYTLQKALKELLAQTTLRAQFINARTVAIRTADVAQSSSRSTEASEGLRLAQSAVHGTAEVAEQGQSDSKSAADPSPGAENKDIRVDEIVVTAQKRSERLQDVPMSITALSGEVLAARGARDFEDYAIGVPGIAFSSTSPAGYRGAGPTIRVRGIGGAGFGPTTGYYINDTPIPAQNLKLIDIERVEVLKGPQGTLYGSRAMGGLVKVVTRQARADRLEGMVSMQGSRTDRTKDGGGNYELAGVLNVPLIDDKLAARFVGYAVSKDGYIDKYPATDPVGGVDLHQVRRGLNYEHINGGRASVRWTPTDALAITLNALVESQRVGDIGYYDTYVRDTFGALASITPIAEPVEQDLRNFSVTFDYDVGPFAVVASSSLYDADSATTENRTFFGTTYVNAITASAPAAVAAAVSAGALPAGTTVVSSPNTSYFLPSSNVSYYGQKAFIEELRFESRGDGPWRWQVGGFFRDFKNHVNFYGELTDVIAATTATIDVPGQGLMPYALLANDILINRDGITDTREYGAFGDLTYKPAEKWAISAGLRWYDVHIDDSLRDISASIFVPNPALLPTTYKIDESGLNPRVSLTYKPADTEMLYLVAAKGFREGGYVPTDNYPARCGADLAAHGITLGDPVHVKSDSLWNYELGAKTEWLGGRLVANAAAYLNEWKDIQQSVVLACGVGLLQNAGAAESRGAEIEIVSRPLAGLDLGVAVGYLDAKITEGGGGTFREGLRLPLAPEWTYTLTAGYSQPVMLFGHDLTGFLRADYQFTDDTRLGFTEDRYSFKPATRVANIRLGLARNGWQGTLFVENVLNDEGLLADQTTVEIGGPIPFGSDNRRIRILRPRTVGLSFAYNF